jgi:Caspase domain
VPRTALAFLFLSLSFLAAHAEGRRVALVVGISQYDHAPALANTLNDARDMSAALKRMGFDVEAVLDPTRTELEAAIRRYGDKSADAEASVFHYSGHALEATGHNWLLPTTMKLNNARDLRFEAIDLNTVLEQTDGAKVSIIFLDACRDNPFLRRLTGDRRAVGSGGLARVDASAEGMLVAFATAPGQFAFDGDKKAKNSPFTAALLHHIETKGLEVKALLARVTKAVLDETKGKQRPWVNSSLQGDFYFRPGDVTPVAKAATDLDALFWDTIKASNNPADFKAYLEKFPDGVFAGLAKNRLSLLDQPKPESATRRPASLRDLLLERFTALAVRPEQREPRAVDYEAEKTHRAIAVAPTSKRTWRLGNRSSAVSAAAADLEGCQLYYREPCILAAVDNEITASDKASPSDMFRTRHSGLFDPDQIPAIDDSARNDPNHFIYPVLEMPPAALDQWMQAWFSILKSQLGNNPFPRNNVYRIYINPTNGIAPGTGVSLTFPLFTALKAVPVPMTTAWSNPGTGLGMADTFIEWWSAGNLLIYTSPGTTSAPQPPSLTNELKRPLTQQKPLSVPWDPQNPPVPTAGGPPTCTPVTSKAPNQPVPAKCEPLTIYVDTSGIGKQGGDQLLEYTLGAVNANATPAPHFTDWINYWMDTHNVDFDISYVDVAWMPGVMGTFGNDQVGYTGTPQSIDAFKLGANKDGKGGLTAFKKCLGYYGLAAIP